MHRRSEPPRYLVPLLRNCLRSEKYRVIQDRYAAPLHALDEFRPRAIEHLLSLCLGVRCCDAVVLEAARPIGVRTEVDMNGRTQIREWPRNQINQPLSQRARERDPLQRVIDGNRKRYVLKWPTQTYKITGVLAFQIEQHCIACAYPRVHIASAGPINILEATAQQRFKPCLTSNHSAGGCARESWCRLRNRRDRRGR